jgi:hypothetical protein
MHARSVFAAAPAAKTRTVLGHWCLPIRRSRTEISDPREVEVMVSMAVNAALVFLENLVSPSPPLAQKPINLKDSERPARSFNAILEKRNGFKLSYVYSSHIDNLRHLLAHLTGD